MRCRGTRWPRLAEGLLKAGHRRSAQLHNELGLKVCFQSINAAAQAYTSVCKAPKDTRRSPLSPVSIAIGRSLEEPDVDPDSLHNTLEAHREANRASLIVKVAGKGSIRQPIQAPSFLKRKEPVVRGHGTAGARHLNLAGYLRKRRKQDRRRAKETREERVTCNGQALLTQWAPRTETQRSQRYPWMRHMKRPLQSSPGGLLAGMEQLRREIDAFYSYSQPNPQEVKAADQALQDISAAIKEAVPNIKIDVVGSRATGLALPMSDIDLNISNPTSGSSVRSTKNLLTKVANHLVRMNHNKGLLRGVTTRFRPKIPLVTGRHARTHLEFQVQSTVDVFLSMQQTMSFVSEFPTLRKLFIFLKQVLTMRGLDLGAEQGLSSYPLLIMIVAALKFSEWKVDRHDAGAHLLNFLDMYSAIDFTTTAISFSPLQYIVKRHPHSSTLPHAHSGAMASDSAPEIGYDSGCETQDVDARRRFATIKPDAEFLMCLQDPADLQNDLGRAAYRIREVQTAFIHLREDLKARLKTWDHGGGNREQEPLLASCVGGDYQIYEHMRHDLELSVHRMK